MFILPSLKAGGAERVISFVAQHLDPQKFEVTLLVQGYKKDQVFEVENINLVILEKPRLISAIPAIFREIRRISPSIVVGSIGHVNLLLGCFSLFFPNKKFIAREASVNNIMAKYSTRKQVPLWIRSFLYGRLDAIICQSNDMKSDMKSMYKIPDEKCIIINNPITFKESKLRKVNANSSKHFITIGRLSEEKGHERILRVLSKLPFEFEYLIIGDGPLKSKIKDLINELGLSAKITMLDYTSNIRQYLSVSDFFLQGSYVEGFPNALLEAASMGMPSIAFNAPGGTNEIILSGKNGLLVENENEFKLAIEKALSMNWKREEISMDIYLRFSSESIVEKYASLFKSF